MVKKKAVDISHLTALSSDSEDDVPNTSTINKPESSEEVLSLKEENVATPTHKKKKAKKDKSQKSADVSLSEEPEMGKKKAVDISHLTALSSDSEDDVPNTSTINKPESSEEVLSLKEENVATPTPHKKKKAKKDKSQKSADVSLSEEPEPAETSETPGPKKKKKKNKDARSESSKKRRRSLSTQDESASERDSLRSPKLKTRDSVDLQFTSSDVGSQETPTKKTVQNIIDSLASSSSEECDSSAKQHKTLKSPKKSERVSLEEKDLRYSEGHQIKAESEVEQNFEITPSKSSKKKKKHKKHLSDEYVVSESEDLQTEMPKVESEDLQTETPKVESKSDTDVFVELSQESEASTPVSPAASHIVELESSDSSNSDAEDDFADSGPKKAVQPLRYNPEKFSEVTSFESPWFEELQKNDKELWLVKIPEGFDYSFLEGESVTWNQKKVVKTENNENENFQSVWEISANKLSEKQPINLTALLPSKEDKVFHSVGQIAGQITLTRGVALPEYIMPQTGLKSPPQIPNGLKRRHQPFGADTPMNTVKEVHSKSAKKKKKDKKHRHSIEGELDTSFKKKKAKKEKADKN